ncbi:MAG TPA: hypothetical protein VF139_09005 [Candidatus Polarisedimenticolaceae bacterium]
MLRVFRAACLLILALLGVRAWRVTMYDAEFRAAARAYDERRYRIALERFERALDLDPSDPLVWTWIGDAAGAVRVNPPPGGWTADDEARLLDRMWSAYAGAVLRLPCESWSWSGLADVALFRAGEIDADRGVDLDALERRARGELDPWRAAALGAAMIAVERKPSGFLELDVLAKVYESAGQSERARETYRASARRMPAPSLHEWGRGSRRLPDSLVDEVLLGLREGLTRAPRFDLSRLHLEVGRFALAHGRLAEARQDMEAAERAAATTHERYHALRGRAETAEAMGDLAGALAAWDGVVATGHETPGDLRQRGLVLQRSGRATDACVALRTASRSLEGDDALRVVAASACEQAGELVIAERLLRDGFVDPGDDPTMARALLDFYERTGKRRTAVNLAQSWARNHPERKDFEAWAEALGSDSP